MINLSHLAAYGTDEVIIDQDGMGSGRWYYTRSLRHTYRADERDETLIDDTAYSLKIYVPRSHTAPSGISRSVNQSL